MREKCDVNGFKDRNFYTFKIFFVLILPKSIFGNEISIISTPTTPRQPEVRGRGGRGGGREGVFQVGGEFDSDQVPDDVVAAHENGLKASEAHPIGGPVARRRRGRGRRRK